jgi:hypothetical protein
VFFFLGGGGGEGFVRSMAVRNPLGFEACAKINTNINQMGLCDFTIKEYANEKKKKKKKPKKRPKSEKAHENRFNRPV